MVNPCDAITVETLSTWSSTATFPCVLLGWLPQINAASTIWLWSRFKALRNRPHFKVKRSSSGPEDDDPLALAQRRVWQAQRIVSEQKKRIAHLRASGASTWEAVTALYAFETNLRLFREYRESLLSVKRRRQ